MKKVFGLDGPAPKGTPAAVKASLVTPMPEPLRMPEGLKHFGDPDNTWVYRKPDGSAYGAVVRWNKEDGKEIRPIVWDGKDFISSGLGDGRPLLNSEIAASLPIAPVLIVEGEKTLDAAAQYTPEGWVVVTWSGGAGAWDKSDWSALKGHPCIIWPDNDEPGMKAASGIQLHLSKLKLATAIVTMSPQFPTGWDLADPLPVGNPKTITEILKRKLKEAAVLEVPDDMPAVVDVSSEFEDSDFLYRALGYDEMYYYVMPYRQQQVHAYPFAKLVSSQGCLEIVTDLSYWQRGYGDEKGRVDWQAAGVYIANQCTAGPVYDPINIRERGVWSDDGRTVLHTGDTLIVEGKVINPARFKSEFIYPRRPRLLQEWSGVGDPAPDTYGRLIRDVCNKVRWEKPIYGDLLAGWIATAVVCGGLPWRTHCWITGNQGSGKTTVVNYIAGACLGGLAIYPVGESTEAGIRQSVRNDARPVVFDESESSKNKEERRQAVIQLMRQSSSESRGRIMKGSANHQAVSFTLRSTFLMSSIGVGLKEAADLTRTSVLTVRPQDARTATEREQAEQKWKEFMKACASVPADAPERLLSRQVNNLATLRKNIEVFKRVIAGSIGDGRLGDQLGTLLAGCYSLVSTSEVTNVTCERYLDRYDWTEFTSVKTQREDLALLFHLAGSTLRVEGSGGYQERLVGELIEIAMRNSRDERIAAMTAEDVLKRNGIKVDNEKGGVWLGIKVPNLNRIMSTSDYFEGWQRVLERHPRVVRSENAVKFAGVSSRALFIPKQEFMQIEG